MWLLYKGPNIKPQIKEGIIIRVILFILAYINDLCLRRKMNGRKEIMKLKISFIHFGAPKEKLQRTTCILITTTYLPYLFLGNLPKNWLTYGGITKFSA